MSHFRILGCRSLFAIAALLAVIVFTGCAKTALGVYDPSVPSEKLCTLEIDHTLTITEFDGKSVDWGGLFGATIQIPAGVHTLLVDFAGGTGAIAYSAENIVSRHRFEAGKTYLLHSEVLSNRVFLRLGVRQ